MMNFYGRTPTEEEEHLLYDIYSGVQGTPESVLLLFSLVSYFDIPESFEYDSLESIRAEYKGVPKDVRWDYWRLWSLSEHPHRGLLFLRDSGWLDVFPEIFSLVGIPQNEKTHPEGDVFNHTVLSVKEAAILASRDEVSEDERIVLTLSALCHDFGKATVNDKTHGTSGVELAENFLRGIGAPSWVISQVGKLIYHHMADEYLFGESVNENQIDDVFVRFLGVKVLPASVENLIRLHEADMRGRTLESRKPTDKFLKIKRLFEVGELESPFRRSDVEDLVLSNALEEEFLAPGIHQDSFIDRVNRAYRKGLLSIQEIRSLPAYLFSPVYRDTLFFVMSLDYRELHKLSQFISHSGADLDSLLLKGKTYVQGLLS